MSDQEDSSPKKEGMFSGCIVEGMSTGCIVALVIGVVGFVILFLVPAGTSRRRIGGRSLQAKAQMQGIGLAVKAYQIEYSRLPAFEDPPPPKDNTQGYDTTREQGRRLVDILTAKDVSKNPRQIPFYEPPPFKKGGGGYSPTGGLVDVWGSKGYIIILDYDGDGQIADPEHPGSTISAAVLVYSAGPDLDSSTWKDNLKSWD